MEQELLQIVAAFMGGVVVGVVVMLIFNKLSSGSASPNSLKQEFDNYQNEVESHFEETSKKFKDMTDQYQDLYKHLSVGATSLCRPESVAAALADQSSPMEQPAKLEEQPVSVTEAAAESEPEALKPQGTLSESETKPEDAESKQVDVDSEPAQSDGATEKA